MSLKLNDNQITTIPTEIVNLTDLRYLYLTNNKITTIPKEIYNMNLLIFEVMDGNIIIDIPVENEELTKSMYLNYVYFYNANRNKCLRTTGKLDTPLTYGTCDGSDNTLWLIPNSHSGFFRSKINSKYCLSIEDEMVSLKECNENTTLYRDGNFIKSISSDNYCIGSSNSRSKEISLIECDESDPDQIWYFNIYDSSSTNFEKPVNTYFYNANKDKCIVGYMNSVALGKCGYYRTMVWEIPVSHEGYYRLRTNKNCLSIVDGVVSLGECDENTVLYRDGNFIRSPLSDDHCIVIGANNKLEYIENCDENNPDHIWYFNTYTDPFPTNAQYMIEWEMEHYGPEYYGMDSLTTEIAEPTKTAEQAEIVEPTEIVTSTSVTEEENPTMTITTTVTAVMTEAY